MKRAMAVGSVVACMLFASLLPATEESNPTKELSTLEGVLKVHPKFLYKYYIEAYGGQTCALYGFKRDRDPEMLKDIEPGTYIRVQGKLATFLHEDGGDPEREQFGRTWVIYMEVKEATNLKEVGD